MDVTFFSIHLDGFLWIVSFQISRISSRQADIKNGYPPMMQTAMSKRQNDAQGSSVEKLFKDTSI